MVKAIHDLVQHHAKISPTKLGHLELRLLADEAGGLLHEPSITTVTFYRGAVSQLALRMALRTQLFKVVSKNPWLAGRLIEKEKVWVHQKKLCKLHSHLPTTTKLTHLARHITLRKA